MTSFDVCTLDDFMAEATPQSGSLAEAASTQEILIQQLEGYLNRMREAVCTDVLALQVSINAIVPGTGMPNLADGVEVASGRQVQATGALEDSFFKLIDIGGLPNNANTLVAHGISRPFTVVSLYGAANDPSGGSELNIPLPFTNISFTVNNVMVFVDATDISITTGTDRTNFTDNYVILEYVKS